jgi:thiol-disulfide isomerase/thioredoxin
MHRLSSVLALCAAGWGCESKAREASSPAVDAFCDKHYAGDTGPALTLPALVDGSITPPGTTWRWINVWSTWCKPCVDELPRLVRWHDQRVAAGKPFDLAFISIDEDPADLASFRREYPATPASPRLANPADQGAWYAALGLPANAPVPIHVFVRPSGHIACARARAVRDGDLPVVETLLAE